ncbi:MAG: hypothetical protein JSU88_07675 [Nitrospinaceae bacterium]|jgi:DNA repair exonuclease SbcCD ATPase subunit|nr:MAG: hypothetical protein JSU88_07675 [Nitrospinaceae bacterium]
MVDPQGSENFEARVQRAQDNFKVISELREKLEILSEHVASRKEALEEEIEEHLHEAIRNSKDCLEKIQENIDPKLEKVIREKLAEIDRKMDCWKRDAIDAVGEEIQKEAPALTQKVLWELDQTVVEKVQLVKKDLQGKLEEAADARVQEAIKSQREALEEQGKRLMTLGLMGIGLGALALALGLMAFVR